MKKILYVIFCCLFMTAVFTGCGGNEKSASGAAKHLNLVYTGLVNPWIRRMSGMVGLWFVSVRGKRW